MEELELYPASRMPATTWRRPSMCEIARQGQNRTLRRLGIRDLPSVDSVR